LTVDESWFHNFNPESKVQSMAWKYASPPLPRKFRVVASACKIMATVFWDAEAIALTDRLNMAAPSQEPTILIWSEKFGRH